MKHRVKMSYDVADFTLIDAMDLRAHWDNSPPLLRDLHQCTTFCRMRNDGFHAPFCDYLAQLDHASAVADALAYLSANAGGRVQGEVRIGEVSHGGVEGSPQAELTLSLLTDPITLTRRGTFDNGRHRATAFFDAGVVGLIPVRYIP